MKTVTLPDGRMVKGGWVAPPNAKYGGTDFLNDEVFSDVAKSGVNLLFPYIDPVNDPEDFLKYAKLCKKHGVYTMVSDHRFADPLSDEKQLIAAIEYYKNLGSVFGISVCDEPGRTKFASLGECYNKYKPYLGDLKFYINHMPMYAVASQINGGWWSGKGTERESTTEEYAEFIEDFLKTVDIPVLSYDFYPFRFEEGVPDCRYFEQLTLCREKAEKYGKALWNFTQLTSWNKDYIRNTEFFEIAYLNNTSLACGVTGLQYFCYWTPTDCGGESFLSAMITRDGKRTKHYAYVKKLNEEISRVEKFFLEAEHKGVISIGDGGCPFPEKANIHSFGRMLSADTCGAIIGCFDYNGKEMYYVVNGSPVKTRTVELKFDGKVDADVYEHGFLTNIDGESISLVLSGGEGVLIILKG